MIAILTLWRGDVEYTASLDHRGVWTSETAWLEAHLRAEYDPHDSYSPAVGRFGYEAALAAARKLGGSVEFPPPMEEPAPKSRLYIEGIEDGPPDDRDAAI